VTEPYILLLLDELRCVLDSRVAPALLPVSPDLPLCSSVYFVVKVLALTMPRDFGDFFAPPGLFSTFIANKALIQFLPWVILAPPLRDAWVALGWPKGHPKPNPNQAEGRSPKIRKPGLKPGKNKN
jgi:hypothetical protein